MKMHVLIADADEQFRTELITALGNSDGFEVAGVAADGEEALQMLKTKQADILVMDLLLSKYDGLTIMELIQNMYERPQILIATAFISNYVAYSAIRLGAKQLIRKPCGADVVINGLRQMATGVKGHPIIFRWNGDQRLKSLTTHILHDIGVPAHIKGYQYVREAIILSVKDEDKSNAIIKCRYDQVAQVFDTTASRVERAIRHAVEMAWDRGDLDTLQRYFGYTVSNIKGKPTNTEFISIITDHIRLWMKENADQLK